MLIVANNHLGVETAQLTFLLYLNYCAEQAIVNFNMVLKVLVFRTELAAVCDDESFFETRSRARPHLDLQSLQLNDGERSRKRGGAAEERRKARFERGQ